MSKLNKKINNYPPFLVSGCTIPFYSIFLFFQLFFQINKSNMTNPWFTSIRGAEGCKTESSNSILETVLSIIEGADACESFTSSLEGEGREIRSGDGDLSLSMKSSNGEGLCEKKHQDEILLKSFFHFLLPTAIKIGFFIFYCHSWTLKNWKTIFKLAKFNFGRIEK